MIERFDGNGGRAALVEELTRQVVVNGDVQLAEALADNVILKEFDAEEILIEQHGEDNSLYFILTGEITIVINGETIATRLSGAHVGEMAMIDRRAVRSAQCKAAGKAVMAEISERDFSVIAEEHPKLWRGIASVMSLSLIHI